MSAETTRTKFVSWHWRFLLPVFGIILIVAMVLAFNLPQNPAAEGAANPLALAAQLRLTRLLLAGGSATVVIVVFVAVNLMLGRINQARRVVDSLTAGNSGERTRMKPSDEIGALGQAIDRYADSVEERQDHLRTSLRRQRREVEHLTAVFEALPHGVIVQDYDGKVIHINDRARKLLNADRAPEVDLTELTAVVTDTLGLALAPGLYALGDPKHVELEGRMLSAQAAAVTSVAKKRVGTVIILNDITEEIRRERAREKLLSRLERNIQVPLATQGQLHAGNGNMNEFAREMTRHSLALQKLIVEMRELTADFKLRGLNESQRPLRLETLIWALSNEWRQVAQAANLSLDVVIEQRGLFVLGDERRLRWALGNLVDNAIKYTPPGGAVTLEIRGEVNGMAHLRLRDNGVGIHIDELPHMFVRFFRGEPVTKEGRAIHVPGTGQGLSITKQIIEMHGGNIRLKSTQWVGTAAYVALPLTSPVSLEIPRLYNLDDADSETIQLRDLDSATVRIDSEDQQR